MAFQVGAFQSSPAFQTTIPGRGPAGVAVFVLDIEEGADVTYEWATDVIPGRRGVEHRIQLDDVPRETYGFEALVSDAQLRTIQSRLATNASSAGVFLVGLMHEAATIVAGSTGFVITVGSTALLDWVFPGSRVAVFDQENDVVTTAVIQASTATTINLDTASVARAGMVIMPTMACYLDATQQLGQHTYDVTRWAIRARAILFGYQNDLWTINGSSVTTYDGFPIWDKGNEAEDVVSRVITTGVEIVDRGGVLAAYGGTSGPFVTGFARQLRTIMATPEDRQHFKLFMGTVVGRQGAFLLPSGRADIPWIGDASTGNLSIHSPTGHQYGIDLRTWFLASRARDYLQITLSTGAIHYRKITDVGDAGVTQTIVLDTPLVGTIAAVQVAEKVRFGRDALTVAYRDARGYVDEQVIVVED
jgi:hypothetical protein